ncbi:protein of unknown function (plasmid) [Candidatus Promineifilum breve]|jgi:hypothetical protein|uniref:Uncharacterized protein n=1 Tax=Candidatus Promineifilum breve TaxID=1806508 RepID=A0A160T8D6_9CHLR|nr:hypothetical protein [Candidatus Promineifilum breve]CUS06424.1 protein of unknown function [Candidatus Promineifilum breve]
MDNNHFIDVLRDKIAALEQELAAFFEDANRQIVAQQGAIVVLKQLLAEIGPDTEPEATEA